MYEEDEEKVESWSSKQKRMEEYCFPSRKPIENKLMEMKKMRRYRKKIRKRISWTKKMMRKPSI